VSIFVNPLQFGVGEDYHSYPHTLEEDSQKLEQMGSHLLFTPSMTDIYPAGMETSTYVKVPKISEILCGASRPTHFKGVTTIVNILFNLLQPDKALFGEKDYQQLLIIKRMVVDLFIPVKIISVPTVRETDGLAMSSRNHYLNKEQRAIAPYLFQSIDNIRKKIETGERDFTHLENKTISHLKETGFKPDYITIRQAQTLEIPSSEDKILIILAAARLGKTRLIDNVRCLL